MLNHPQQTFQDLTRLKAELEGAISNQEYHKFLGIDEGIRDAVAQLTPLASKSIRLSELLSKELNDLKSIYESAVNRCTEQSDELKKEYQSVMSSKKAANKYLDVGSKFGQSGA